MLPVYHNWCDTLGRNPHAARGGPVQPQAWRHSSPPEITLAGIGLFLSPARSRRRQAIHCNLWGRV
jgi:hypothetical protein